jgi:hypothetical protein
MHSFVVNKNEAQQKKRSVWKLIIAVVVVILVIGFLRNRGGAPAGDQAAAQLAGQQFIGGSVAVSEQVPQQVLTTQPTGTYRVEISEAELNSALNKDLAGKQVGENPVTAMSIDILDGAAGFTMHWAKGQQLTGVIEVASGGKTLTITDVDVTGAGLLNAVFEQVADDVIGKVLESFFFAQSGNLVELRLEPNVLVGYYKL